MSDTAITLPRLVTGNCGLDEILNGGLPANSINIIMGEPGNGKTILAEQIIFHNASDDFPCLMLTTLSEPFGKIVRYLQTYTFFDFTKINSAVRYEPIGEALTEGGVAALVPRLKAAIDDYQPRLIVIDSYKALHDISVSLEEMRRVTYELAGLLTAYETTTLLIGEYNDEQAALLPEFAIADSIIQLHRVNRGVRDDRYLRVNKLRGSSYSEGLHAFTISKQGLNIYPRLVSPRIAPGYQPSDERMNTGVAGLDELLDGGLRCGTTTMLKGSTGCGKTTLAMQFIVAGLRAGNSCLYVNFQENPSQLEQMMIQLGFDATQREKLRLIHISPVELSIDRIIVELFQHLRSSVTQRVVIDAAGDLAVAAVNAERIHDYLYAMIQHFAVNDVTAMIIFESDERMSVDGLVNISRLSHMSDNIIELGIETGRRTRRTLRIIKSRRSASDLNVHTAEIRQDGLHVIDNESG